MEKSKKICHHLKTIAVVFLISSIIIFGLGALKVYLHGKVLPGSTIEEEQIALIDEAQLEKKIFEKIKNLEAGPYIVRINNTEKKFTAGELGVTTNYEKTRNKIKIFNAHEDGLGSILASATGLNEAKIDFEINKNEAIKNIEKSFEIKPQRAENAKLYLDGKKQLKIKPEKEGKKIETRNLRKNLTSLIKKETKVLELKIIEEKPGLQADGLFSQKEELEKVLKIPIKLEYGRYEWDFKPIEHLEWLKFKDGRKIVLKDFQKILPILGEVTNANEDLYEIRSFVEVELKDEFQEFVEKEIATKINTAMQKAEIYYDDKNEIIINGRAINGQTVHRKRLQEMISLAINNKINSVKIPVKLVKAEVDTDEKLQKQGIKELLSTGHTSYFGSPSNRRHNIWVGTNKYNGLIIKQGEEFSFNKNLGPVEAYTGYLPELVIKGDEGTIPEYGGGLCQVSSTTYRAALLAGLPITARNPHSYAVSYYAQILGYGLDATIYPGVSDVRFINDTPGDILIQSYVEYGHVYFKFYGTSDGRSTELEGPYISNRKAAPPTLFVETPELPPGVKEKKDNAHNGFDATWFRYITKEGTTHKETIFSRYKAIPERIFIGIGKQ